MLGGLVLGWRAGGGRWATAEEEAQGAGEERSHCACGQEEPAHEGERPREKQNAQPERRSGHSKERASRFPRRHQTYQDRDFALCPQLHLGPLRNHPDCRPAPAQTQGLHASSVASQLRDRSSKPRERCLLLVVRCVFLVFAFVLHFQPQQPSSYGWLWIFANRRGLQLPQLRPEHLLNYKIFSTFRSRMSDRACSQGECLRFSIVQRTEIKTRYWSSLFALTVFSYGFWFYFLSSSHEIPLCFRCCWFGIVECNTFALCSAYTRSTPQILISASI